MAKKAAGNKDREARRKAVAELLRQVNDEKAVRASGKSVLARAELTYTIATTPPAILGPLRCIAAYRLAHLLLRSTEPDLDRANNVFEEASTFPPLSVVTQIYRVALLERLLKMEPKVVRRKGLESVRKDANLLVNLIVRDWGDRNGLCNSDPVGRLIGLKGPYRG